MPGFETSVIQSLAYFDIFDYPLTKEELYRFLWEGERTLLYEDFLQRFDALLKETHLFETEGGYIFFRGRSDIIAIREQRVWYTEEKMRIAIRAARLFRWIPFLRAMFVCNQLPVGVSKESDIDVFIIVKAGRLWITRLLTTILASVFGLRRFGEHVANYVCLSFYCTDDALDLSAVAIESPDVYQIYWLAQLIPVYDPDTLHAEIAAKNEHARNALPHAFKKVQLIDRWHVSRGRVSFAVKRFFEISWQGILGDMIEQQARALQLQKMKRNAESKQFDRSTDVVISDRMLKFHENDRRRMFQQKWREKISNFK